MRVAFLSSLVAFTATTTGNIRHFSQNMTIINRISSDSRYIPTKGCEDRLEQASHNQVGLGAVSLLVIEIVPLDYE